MRRDQYGGSHPNSLGSHPNSLGSHVCVCAHTRHGETIFTCKIIRPWILNYFQILWDSLIQKNFICDFHIMTCACTLYAMHDGVRECAMFSYQ